MPKSHPLRLESTSFQLPLVLIFWFLPVNHKCPQRHLEWGVLSRRFSTDLPRFIRNEHLWCRALQNVYVREEDLRIEITPWSLGCRMEVVLADMKTVSSLYISIRALGRPHALSRSSSILKGIFFFWVDLNSKLKIFSKPCWKQRCCHSGFVVPFTEHRQRGFSIILKGSRIFGVVNDHCF